MIWSRKIYLTVHTRLSIASKGTGIRVVVLQKFNHEISVLLCEIFRALRSSLIWNLTNLRLRTLEIGFWSSIPIYLNGLMDSYEICGKRKRDSALA